jgi:C4-dicarboxylate-specific signal transduction histidine kinase
MSAVPNLLARRQKLLQQLAGDLSEASREDIERQLEQINTALELLELLDASKDRRK